MNEHFVDGTAVAVSVGDRRRNANCGLRKGAIIVEPRTRAESIGMCLEVGLSY